MFRWIISLLLIACAGAKELDYFPLQTGNQWVYRCTRNCLSADTFTLEIVGTAPSPSAGSPTYYILRGLAKDWWVRMADFGRLVARDPEGGPERLWYDFSAPEKQEYETFVHPCNVTAKITSKKFDYQGPIGSPPALRIEYPATTCNLQGLVEEIFLPGIGLGRRVDLVPGNRTYDLIFARVGNLSFAPQSELSFTVALDRAVYSIGHPDSSPAIVARLTLRNTTPDPLRTFVPPSPYDLEVKNEHGETVYRWSDGRILPPALIPVDLSPGELNYIIVIPLANDFANALPPGPYTAEAWLNTVQPPRGFSSKVTFQIEWLR